METVVNEIERSQTFTKKKFHIDAEDMPMMMNIFRNKMYTQPIKVLIQEIACNARDAHREIGTPDKPIWIQLPNAFDQNFAIRDEGIGISPDRMGRVFLAYGKTTKGHSNDFTGGYGMGAKTPFAYTDSFTIETINHEDGKNVKRIYLAYIGEDNAGDLDLLSTAETTEHTGTRISLAAREKDYPTFESYTKQIFKFWDNKPIITGSKYFSFKIDTNYLESNKKCWFTGNENIVLVDQIPYNITFDYLFPFDIENTEYNKKFNLTTEEVAFFHILFNKGISFSFNTGEVRVAIQRESIEINDELIKTFIRRLRSIVLKESIRYDIKLRECKTYSDAIQKYFGQSSTEIIRNLKTRTWQGIPIRKFFEVKHYDIKAVGMHTVGSSINNISLRTTNKIILIVNDTDKVSARLKTLDTNFPTYSEKYLICKPKFRPEKRPYTDKEIDQWEKTTRLQKEIHDKKWDFHRILPSWVIPLVTVVKLSNFEPFKAVTTDSTVVGKAKEKFVLKVKQYSHEEEKFVPKEYSLQSNVVEYYVDLNANGRPINANGDTISWDCLREFIRLVVFKANLNIKDGEPKVGVEVYGTSPRIQKPLMAKPLLCEVFEMISDFYADPYNIILIHYNVIDFISKIKSYEDYELFFVNDSVYKQLKDFITDIDIIRRTPLFHITNSNSYFYKYVDRNFIKAHPIVKNYHTLLQRIQQKYPLFMCFDAYVSEDQKGTYLQICQDVIEYRKMFKSVNQNW